MKINLKDKLSHLDIILQSEDVDPGEAGTISNLEARIARIDGQITKHRSELERLQDQKMQLEQQINRLKLSP